MKKMILTFALFSSLSLMAQSDPYLKLVNLGEKKIEITNFQNCSVDIEIDGDGITSVHPNNKNSKRFLQIPTGTSEIRYTGNPPAVKIRALTICQWKGQEPTWIILGAAGSLPVKMRNLQVRMVRN